MSFKTGLYLHFSLKRVEFTVVKLADYMTALFLFLSHLAIIIFSECWFFRYKKIRPLAKEIIRINLGLSILITLFAISQSRIVAGLIFCYICLMYLYILNK